MGVRQFLCVVLVTFQAFAFHAVGLGQVRAPRSVRVAPSPTLKALIADEDTDGDRNITIDDPRIPESPRGDRRFTLRSPDGQSFMVAGTYHLSNLLALLKRGEETGADSIDITADLFAPPSEQIARAIKEHYWKGLTRTVDEKGLEHLFQDEKTRTIDGLNYVYVPHDDSVARLYFTEVGERHPEWKMRVVALPATVTPAFVRGLDGRHGILSLGLRRDSSGVIGGIPFVVPGGRFNELYGWDSYFILLGLLHDGRVDVAKSIVDNFGYEIRYYGKILNANRTYYLTRSQPPFLTSMALAVYSKLPRGEGSKKWLRDALAAAIEEYDNVWMGAEHLTETGLSRYYDSGFGPPPEVEPGRFDSLFAAAARELAISPAAFQEGYTGGRIRSAPLDRYFQHDRGMRESGHDASYRLVNLCADLVTVDLNSLLYKIESDIASVIEREFGGSLSLPRGIERSEEWNKRARRRRELVTRYLWNEKSGMFFDYNCREGRQTEFVSATTFYPLWSGLASEIQASRLVANALPLLGAPGGIAGSTEESRGPINNSRPQSQWDYPFGWAPHQLLLWGGLQRYRHGNLAREYAYRWLYTIASNACDYNGTIAEKYDVVNRSAQVFAEYGNVGTKFSYITREGFGWTNASFVIGRSILTSEDLDDLNRLIPPEWR